MHLNCNKCPNCVKSRRNDWTFRLFEHLKDSNQAHFVTLTYNDKNLVYGEKHPTLYYPDTQDFFKRLRKMSKAKNLKYYLVGEYGDKNYRPHYHAIIYNVEKKYLFDAWTNNIGSKRKPKYEAKGIVHVGTVTQDSIYYVTKYIHKSKQKNPPGTEDQRSLMSKNLGYGYIKRTRAYHQDTENTFVTKPGGYKQALPKYYAKKIWDDNTRRVIYNNANMQRLRQWSIDTYLNLITPENFKFMHPIHALAVKELTDQENKKLEYLEYINSKKAISKKV